MSQQQDLGIVQVERRVLEGDRGAVNQLICYMRVMRNAIKSTLRNPPYNKTFKTRKSEMIMLQEALDYLQFAIKVKKV